MTIIYLQKYAYIADNLTLIAFNNKIPKHNEIKQNDEYDEGEQ